MDENPHAISLHEGCWDEPITPVVGFLGVAVGLLFLFFLLVSTYLFHSQNSGYSVKTSGSGTTREMQEQLALLARENSGLLKQLGRGNDGDLISLRDQNETFRKQIEDLSQTSREFSEANATLLKQLQEIYRQLEEARTVRSTLLTAIHDALKNQGIPVEVAEIEGRLYFPEELTFNSGSTEFSDKGTATLHYLAKTLEHLLPCYLPATEPLPDGCGETGKSRVDAIYFEGHTDDRPARYSRYRDNWTLAAARASGAYHYFLNLWPGMEKLRNSRGEILFRVGGYADRHPREENDTDMGRRKNRRVELRFVMDAPVFDKITTEIDHRE